MIPTKPLFLSAAVLLTACINLPEIDGPSNEDPDAGHTPALTVTLVAPSGATYTNGTVSVQLQLQGDTPEQVELLVDGQPLTTLQAPYTFTWNTISLAEGPHQLSARARIGDKTFASEVRDVVVDRTPPQVVSRTPTPGAQDVWVRQPIQATFSEPLKPSTLTGTSVKLSVGGTEVVTAPSLSADGKTLTVTSATRLVVPNTVQVTLTNAVTDLAGNALTAPSGNWSWSLPLSFPLGDLSALQGNTDASLPFLQMDPSGKLFVSWRESRDGDPKHHNIYIYKLAGTDWQAIGAPIAPANLDAIVSPTPSYVFRLDPGGSPVIAWTQHEGPAANDPNNTYIQRWNGSAWIDLATSPNASLSHQTEDTALALQFDKTGKPIIAWTFIDRIISQDSPLSVWRWAGSNWMDYGTNASSNPPNPFDPIAMLLDDSDKPVVAWSEGDIYVRRWTGGSWAPVGNTLGALPGDTRAGLGDMILDGSNNPIVAWGESDGSTGAIYIARFTGSDWQMLGEPLSEVPGATPAFNPHVQQDHEGNLLVVWEEASQAGQGVPLQINLRRWTGATWATIGAPFILSQENIEPLNISFLLDPSGNLYLAWPEKTGSSAKSIRVHRYNY